MCMVTFIEFLQRQMPRRSFLKGLGAGAANLGVLGGSVVGSAAPIQQGQKMVSVAMRSLLGIESIEDLNHVDQIEQLLHQLFGTAKDLMGNFSRYGSAIEGVPGIIGGFTPVFVGQIPLARFLQFTKQHNLQVTKQAGESLHLNAVGYNGVLGPIGMIDASDKPPQDQHVHWIGGTPSAESLTRHFVQRIINYGDIIREWPKLNAKAKEAVRKIHPEAAKRADSAIQEDLRKRKEAALAPKVRYVGMDWKPQRQPLGTSPIQRRFSSKYRQALNPQTWEVQ